MVVILNSYPCSKKLKKDVTHIKLCMMLTDSPFIWNKLVLTSMIVI